MSTVTDENVRFPQAVDERQATPANCSRRSIVDVVHVDCGRRYVFAGGPRCCLAGRPNGYRIARGVYAQRSIRESGEGPYAHRVCRRFQSGGPKCRFVGVQNTDGRRGIVRPRRPSRHADVHRHNNARFHRPGRFQSPVQPAGSHPTAVQSAWCAAGPVI